jgi:uncharacterized protein (DUF1330 family)
MGNRFYLTVLLYLHEGQGEQFHNYEQRIKPILESYGGRFEKIIKPTVVLGDLPLPDEIHWLSFPTEADFQRYRADSKLAQMADLRGASVKKTIVLSGQAIQIF